MHQFTVLKYSLLFATSVFAHNVFAEIPNMQKVIEQIQSENLEAVRNAFNGAPSGTEKAPETQLIRREFHDRMVQKLHSIDPNFGYVERYEGGNPDWALIATDLIAYYAGEGDATGARETSLYIVDIIKGGTGDENRVWWSVHERTTERHDSGHGYKKWIYPRPGSPNYGYDPNHPGPVVGSSGGPGPITIPPETETPGGVENGMCGDKVNSCTSGVLHGHPPDTAIEHRWTCRHIEGVAGGVRCSKPRSEDGDDENLGRCGDTANTCSGGDYHAHPPDTDSEIIWTCRNRGETYTMSNGQERHSGENHMCCLEN